MKLNPLKEYWKGIKGWGNWRDALDGRFYKVNAIFWWLKADFLRQLRLPAANTRLEKQKKNGGRNYSGMKAWQNERCFQLEPWLFHYFNIYNDEPPTVAWATLCAVVRVCVCVCEWSRRGRRSDNKQTESKGVAKSNWIWWKSSALKKWLIHGYIQRMTVCSTAQHPVRPWWRLLNISDTRV